MPRKSKSAAPSQSVNPDDLINLGEDLEAVREEIATAPILTEETVPPSPVKKDKVPTPLDTEETDRKRKELLILASDGEIQKSVAQIDSKFSTLLGGLDAIEKPEEMEKELKSDPLLRKDLKVAMAWLTPLVPFLGLLSGGVTIGKHVWDKQSTDVGDRAQATDTFARGPFSSEVPPSETVVDHDTVR